MLRINPWEPTNNKFICMRKSWFIKYKLSFIKDINKRTPCFLLGKFNNKNILYINHSTFVESHHLHLTENFFVRHTRTSQTIELTKSKETRFQKGVEYYQYFEFNLIIYILLKVYMTRKFKIIFNSSFTSTHSTPSWHPNHGSTCNRSLINGRLPLFPNRFWTEMKSLDR